MEAPGKDPFVAFGEVMLLESFLDQAIRCALSTLGVHMKLGSLCKHQNDEGAHDTDDVERLTHALAAMQPNNEAVFGFIHKLRMRTGVNEPSEGLRVRSRIYEFVKYCFPDILSDQVSTTKTTAYGQCSISRSEEIDRHPDDAHHLWTLVRPCRKPSVIVQIFLNLSTQVAMLQRDQYQPVAPLMVGRVWYDLLSDLLTQLALSALVFDGIPLQDIIDAMDLVTPESDTRVTLNPVLWNISNADEIAGFDLSWQHINDQIRSVVSASSRGMAKAVSSSTAALLEQCSPRGFLNKLIRYLQTVLDLLETPSLDFYSGIRQTGRFPPGFFMTPENPVGLSSHPQLSDSDRISSPIDISASAMLDPFSPHVAALRAETFAESDPYGSPSERVVQAQAYSAMVMSTAKVVQNLTLDVDSSPGSPTSDVRSQRNKAETHGSQQTLSIGDDYSSDLDEMEMSPSVRKRLSTANMARNSTTSHYPDSNRTTPLLDDQNMDAEYTAIAESPSALLSARHDRRIADPSSHRQMPPPALSFDLQAASIVDNNEPAELPQPSNSGMTTPKSQTGENAKAEKHKYVSDWTHGDVEGGGRPHRRRHDASMFTPNMRTLASTLVIAQPPPQTFLSPRNLAVAAAQRGSMQGTLEAQATPERRRPSPDASAIGDSGAAEAANPDMPQPQITPEHQIGMSADARVWSISRYISRKEDGDTEGGGRKHPKRLRSTNDTILF
ncbi:hypothetical protein LPJ53_005252, partial [Coemansia erecta]